MVFLYRMVGIGRDTVTTPSVHGMAGYRNTTGRYWSGEVAFNNFLLYGTGPSRSRDGQIHGTKRVIISSEMPRQTQLLPAVIFHLFRRAGLRVSVSVRWRGAREAAAGDRMLCPAMRRLV